MAFLGEQGVLKCSAYIPAIKSKQRRVEEERKKNIDFFIPLFPTYGNLFVKHGFCEGCVCVIVRPNGSEP